MSTAVQVQAATPDEAYALGLDEKHWSKLSEREKGLYRLVRPLRKCIYKVQVSWARLEKYLEEMPSSAGQLILNPDFQRGHVWSQEKQVAFIENALRGAAPSVLIFNNPNWNGISSSARRGDLDPEQIVCVDGLQRLTAVRRFMAGEITVFGGLRADDLKGTFADPGRLHLSVEMLDIADRAQLLTFYIDINAGGVVHTTAELDRVRALRAAAQQHAPPRRRAASARAR